MRARSTLFSVLCVAALLVHPASTLATPATIAVDDATPDLSEEGDAWQVSVGVTNLTTGRPRVSATTDRAGCTLTFGSDPAQPTITIEPARKESVQVNIPTACKADDGEFALGLAAGQQPAIPITPAAAEKSTTVWWHLAAFPVGFLGFLLAGARLLSRWPREPQPEPEPEPEPGSATPTTSAGDDLLSAPELPSAAEKERAEWRLLGLGEKLKRPLPALPATWSFKDSWATNLTVIGALLTALFGATDVVKAIIGEDAESTIALAVVGSAVATGFIAAGGVVMATMRNGKSKMTAGGLLLAAAVTTAGALGQLWVGAAVGLELELGVARYGLAIALGLAMLLLVLYWWRTLTLTLDDGTEVADPVDYRNLPLTETMSAAMVIAGAIQANGNAEATELERLLGAVPAPQGHATSPGDDPPYRRRASVLF